MKASWAGRIGLPSTCACMVPLAWASCQAKAASQRFLVEAEQARGRRRGAEPAGRAGAEEAEARARGEAQARGDVDADGDRRDQLGAARAAAHLGGGQRRRQDRGHGVHDRAFVQAVVFLVVHLPGVEEGGGRRRQARRTAPHRHRPGSPQPAATRIRPSAPSTEEPAMPTPRLSSMKTLAFCTAAAGRSAKRVSSAWAAKRAAAVMSAVTLHDGRAWLADRPCDKLADDIRSL